MRDGLLTRWCKVLLLFLTIQFPTLIYPQAAPSDHRALVNQYYIPPAREPRLDHDVILQLVRQKIKYVFVIYQENRSFDSYFGTFPGAEGLFTSKHPAGFLQNLIDENGKNIEVRPFRLGPADAADTDDVDHNHSVIVKKMHIQDGVARMDKFAVEEELAKRGQGYSSLQAMQFGELAMAYTDCDTIPILWGYADKFVLFDHIFQLMTGPSTPGNLAIIGAQSGVTQWILHPDQAYQGNGDRGAGVPAMNDARPFWGSSKDPNPAAQQQPYNPGDSRDNPQKNLTFATLPLTLKGESLGHTVEADRDPKNDLNDVREDVEFISDAARKQPSVAFGWYQEGYDQPDDDDGPAHASYITHHNGPQYFGYIANNPEMSAQLHGLNDFFAAVDGAKLPQEGGAFYVKGGYRNLLGLCTANPDPKVRRCFQGDDDHPVYSDAQISEAMVAASINKIAQSPYWPQSAIIITWDDSEGDYDHVPPPNKISGPDGISITNGPRVPLILISPYARTRYVASQPGNHASVVKFIDDVFNLPSLASLPDEAFARKLGGEHFHQPDLGPQDDLANADVSDLLEAFSPARLKGNEKPLPKEYVMVDQQLIAKLPRPRPYGCNQLDIVPTDHNVTNVLPPRFNPRPWTNPTQKKDAVFTPRECKQPAPVCKD